LRAPSIWQNKTGISSGNYPGNGIPDVGAFDLPDDLGVQTPDHPFSVPKKLDDSSYKNEHHLNMADTIVAWSTPAALNKRAAEFWREREILKNRRISDEAILQIAVLDVNSEESRGVPLRHQQSFEHALEKAERAKEIVLTELARKGGSAPKGNALHELILEIVRKDPSISEKQLLEMLEGEAGAGVVTSIDEPSDVVGGDTPCIHFVNDDGKPKTASVRGLKDRLSKAKKKIKNSR
jgi:hypothetical protein